MPIATSVAVAVLLATPALSSATLPATPPSLTIAVDVEADVPPALVDFMLAETGDIWHSAGFSLIWDQQATKDHGSKRAVRDSMNVSEDERAPAARGRRRGVSVGGAFVPGLRVIIGNDHGSAEQDPHVLPLGWIEFRAESPLQDVYVSFANAIQLLDASDFVVGRVSTMTIKERYVLLGRAMGRALAHEIGHYLLGSKTHTSTGIMQARRGAAELFSSSRRGFQVEGNQRQMIAARLQALADRSDVAPPADF